MNDTTAGANGHDAPIRDFEIAGEPFVINDVFATGHVCSAAEAEALNAARRYSVAAAFRERIKSEKEKGVFDRLAMQAEVTAYANDFVFGGSGGTGRGALAVAALQIAREVVERAIRAKGHRLTDYKGRDITTRARELLEKNPGWYKIAKDRLAAQASLAAEVNL